MPHSLSSSSLLIFRQFVWRQNVGFKKLSRLDLINDNNASNEKTWLLEFSAAATLKIALLDLTVNYNMPSFVETMLNQVIKQQEENNLIIQRYVNYIPNILSNFERTQHLHQKSSFFLSLTFLIVSRKDHTCASLKVHGGNTIFWLMNKSL